MNENTISGRPKLLKDINRHLVIKLIVRHVEISRSELAKLTGLSLPSIMRITEALLEEGLLVEIGKGLSTGGRKPSLLRLKADAYYVIGIEIALKTTLVLSDLSGNILEKWESEDTRKISPLAMLEKLEVEMLRLLDHHQIPYAKLAGIGIGTPGTHFKYQQEIELSVLKGWESLDVADWFEKRRKSPEYLIVSENVARTRTLNELWFGYGKQSKSFLYVFVDKGVGCCLVVNETMMLGQNAVAGELGHTVAVPGGRPCYCGNLGCLEMYVSAGAITREVQRKMRKTVTVSEALKHSDDADHEAILKANGKLLGYSLANLVNLFNPKAVILGGDVPKASRIFSEEAIRTAYDSIFSKDALETPIEVSQITKERDCLGSVALVINAFFKSVSLE